MADKKYYWLKLKEDFFDDDTMQWIEEQPNGDKYELFYLKLCLKSLKSNGTLIRSVGNMLVPYDTKKIAEITRTDIDTVRVAMELFKGIGLVQVLENGEIYLTQLQNMVGSETKWAKYKRKPPELENLQSKSKPTPKKLQTEIRDRDRTRDKDIELDIEKDKEIENNKKKKKTTGLDILIDSYTDNTELKETLRDFIKMRKSIKKPMTDKAMNLLTEKLDKLGSTDTEKIELLNQSILNSWCSVFPLKKENKEKEEEYSGRKIWDPNTLNI